VDLRTFAKNSGVAFLAFLILFLSTGIHDLASHSPVARPASAAPEASFSAGNAGIPAREQCDACFCAQLLNQCLVPVLEIPYLTESPGLRVVLSPEAAALVLLGSEENRGPPATAA